METSILTHTQKYAAAALFSLALRQSQIDRSRHLNEQCMSDNEIVSASDHPKLWIDENFNLLLPIFSFLGLDDQVRHELKETAGDSLQLRHHVRTFLTLLSEESDGTSSERMNRELALANSVDAMVLKMESSAVSSEDSCGTNEYEIECHEKYSNVKTESASEAEKLMTYQKKVTVLFELLSACLAENANADKNCSLKKGYDARHRVALRVLSTWFDFNWTKMVCLLNLLIIFFSLCISSAWCTNACTLPLEALETIIACSLVATEQEQVATEQKQVDKEGEIINSEGAWTMWKRGGVIGAAALTGGTVMAITGGLAAPAIAHGLGALAPSLGSLVPAVGAGGFAAAAGATGSAAGSAAIAASFGAAGAGLTGSKMARRIGSIDEFEFKDIGENHKQVRLAVGIMISGLVFEKEDFVKPWESHKDYLERYALQWESDKLIALSTAIEDWLTSKIAMKLMSEGAMMTVLGTLVAAFALPATFVTAFDLIDSKWAVAVDRSDKAGKLLAEVLMKGLQGNRPVTLVGFSMGARVIFKCLQCLAETGDNAGFVERVVLLGGPISIKDENWEDARKMVAGRFINAYSTNDWMLGVAFRASLLSDGLAGIQPVNIPGIQNIDVTELIESHESYLWMTNRILEQLDLESYYPVFRTPRSKHQEHEH